MKSALILLFLFITLTTEEIFLSEGKEEEKDQLQVEYKELSDPEPNTVLCYPKDLSSDKKLGVIVWAPGAGSKAGDYPQIMKRLASHGFVVIGLASSPGDGSKAISLLNLLDQKYNSGDGPLAGKLDLETVGCSGHSLGGLE